MTDEEGDADAASPGAGRDPSAQGRTPRVSRRRFLEESGWLTLSGFGFLTLGTAGRVLAGATAEPQEKPEVKQFTPQVRQMEPRQLELGKSDAALVITDAYGDALKRPEVQRTTSEIIRRQLPLRRPVAHVQGYWVAAVNMAEVYRSESVRREMESALQPGTEARQSFDDFLAHGARPGLTTELTPMLPAMVGLVFVPDPAAEDVFDPDSLGDFWDGVASFPGADSGGAGLGSLGAAGAGLIGAVIGAAIGGVAGAALGAAIGRFLEALWDWITSDEDDEDEEPGTGDDDEEESAGDTSGIIGACEGPVLCVASPFREQAAALDELLDMSFDGLATSIEAGRLTSLPVTRGAPPVRMVF